MSNYVEVFAIVEGKTEKIFVQSVLAPYLAMNQIYMHATELSKPGQKGGAVTFSRVIRDVGRYLKQRSDTFVTTFFDYYGASDWPDLATAAGKQAPKDIAAVLNDAARREVIRHFSPYRAKSRFIPYMAVHEFEALLFSDSEILASQLHSKKSAIDAVLMKYGEPEAINNSLDTAPSKRLNTLVENGAFKKITTGIPIAERIGVDSMRAACPVFNAWVTAVEGISPL
jgi:hypothetical protein